MLLNKILNSRFFSFTESREIKLLVLIGIVSRIVLFGFYLHVTKVPDSFAFMELTERLLDFNLNNYQGERSLGYPIFLFFAFGSWRLALIYQFIIGILTPIFWYKTLLKLNFSISFSFRFTLFLLSFLCYFFYETTILVEPLLLFLISILFYHLTDNYLSKRNLKFEIYMGFLLGYLVLIKPFFAFLPFLIYGFAVLKNFKFKKLINQKIIILIFPLFAYFGWSYVNKLNTGYFVSTTFYGLNISQNCVYFAEKGPKEYEWIAKPYVKHREIALKENKDVAMSIWYALAAGEFDHKKLSFADLSNEFGKFGKETIKNNQKDYWKQVVYRSWLDFWRPYDIKTTYIDYKFPIVEFILSAIWSFQMILIYIFKCSFLLLTPFYFIKFLRDKKIEIELLIVSTVFATSVLQGIITYGTNAKYAYPFEYLMIIVLLLFVKKYVRFSKRLNKILQ